MIDKKSLAGYKKVRGPFRRRMLRSVNWFAGTFCQDREKRCAFLNGSNLCDLYIHQGEGSLCKTCRLYPRHVEEFEGLREITLSVSCPEVARILMERKTPVTFLTYEKEGEEEYEDFDPFLFSILEDARTEMLGILQDRKLPIEERVMLVWGMAHDMQRRINHQEMFACMDVIEKYCSDRAREFVKEKISDKPRLTRMMFQKLYRLERLKEDWDILLGETEMVLYEKGEKVYRGIWKEFKEWKRVHPDMDISIEQLLVYFLFTYFPGAVYDGEVLAKTQMAVYCVWMIHELWMARWLQNGKNLELEEMTDLVYRFSREVEHSDVNLKQLEAMMRREWK